MAPRCVQPQSPNWLCHSRKQPLPSLHRAKPRWGLKLAINHVQHKSYFVVKARMLSWVNSFFHWHTNEWISNDYCILFSSNGSCKKREKKFGIPVERHCWGVSARSITWLVWIITWHNQQEHCEEQCNSWRIIIQGLRSAVLRVGAKANV